MKKFFISLVLVIFSSFIIGVVGAYAYKEYIIKTADFEVRQWFFMHASNYESTRLNVIANTEDYDLDEMMNKIKRYYEIQYGEADSLYITLFNNEEDFKEFENYEQRTFKKE